MGVSIEGKKDRFFGEDVDQTAAKQLNLDSNHTVFMMATESDYVDDLEDFAEQLNEEGYNLMSPHEFVGKVDGFVQRVKLPDGFRLVGMAPIGAESPKTFGVVDLRSLGYQ